jgi:rRNA maturation protein Nop10
MTLLKKCPTCKIYTIFSKCKKCNEETKDAHYRYFGLRDAPKDFKRKEDR